MINKIEFHKLREKIIDFLKSNLDRRTFLHSLGAEEEALRISDASGRGGMRELARLAALLHDCSKHMSLNEMQFMTFNSKLKLPPGAFVSSGLLHGHISAHLAVTLFGVKDKTILSAVKNHTMGKPGMTALDKILFIADYTEPTRKFEGVENVRAEVNMQLLEYNSLDGAFLAVMKDKIRTLSLMGVAIDPLVFKVKDEIETKLSKIAGGR